jgi:hypothetical protein
MLTLILPALLLAQDPLPEKARLAFTEDWSRGELDPAKWYVLRKKWGNGNHGVVPENVRIERDAVDGKARNVLVCEAHGDGYDGPVVGLWGKKTRVGGVLVSKPFFASGRFEIVMKVGSTEAHPGGPADPRWPRGSVPALWTFGYRWVEVGRERMDQFVPEAPLYNPHMKAYNTGANEYWSELDFPEFGKGGDFTKAMYNTFCQNRHEPKLFDAGFAADGRYHTFTTEWRTKLEPFPNLTDAQVAEHQGFWWVRDKAVPFDRYLGNPLKRLGKDQYALYAGARAVHWIDGKRVGENGRFVPCMAAQLNLGVWLPDWAGPAPWKTAHVRVASVKVWQYDDPGDVRGVLTEDITNNFDAEGRELRR